MGVINVQISFWLKKHILGLFKQNYFIDNEYTRTVFFNLLRFKAPLMANKNLAAPQHGKKMIISGTFSNKNLQKYWKTNILRHPYTFS